MTDEELILRRPANPALLTEPRDAVGPRRLTEDYLREFGLPWAGEDDLTDPAVPREALASPDAWQQWLCEPTGRGVWLENKRGVQEWAPETNFMRRAEVGTETGGYVKTERQVLAYREDIWAQ